MGTCFGIPNHQDRQDMREHLHVLHVVYVVDSDILGAEALLTRYYTTTP
jgi:hypothetical protein